jgi:hypothetical protein
MHASCRLVLPQQSVPIRSLTGPTQLVKHGDDYSTINFELLPSDDEFGACLLIRLPIARERFELLPRILYNGQQIAVRPVLFTQGINEEQTMAIAMGECQVQEEINAENATLLSQYFVQYKYDHDRCLAACPH